MFSRLKPGGAPDVNPIFQYFEVGRQIGSAGPELVWKIYDAVRKSDNREAAVFCFEKRSAEKLHKPKRRETITEILRFSVRQLDRFKHPKMLTLYHPIEESSETLAFATEPVLASLANILGYLEERLPQNLPSSVREYSFLDIEIKYGLLQVTEALTFLHYSCKLIHRNLCPQSVIVNKRGTWKLAGLEFAERCNESDNMSSVPCQPFTSKLPKMGQPDLDFTAPEVQANSTCSPLSDMFSLGMLICSIYNNGRSLIDANHSAASYNKQLELLLSLQYMKISGEDRKDNRLRSCTLYQLEHNVQDLLEKVPHQMQEPLQGLLQTDLWKRPTAQNFSMVKYFMDASVHALQYLDVIQMKDTTHKSHFYHNLKAALPSVPKKLWFMHVLPSLHTELKQPEVLAAALHPILYMVEESTHDEYTHLILPIFRTVFCIPKSVQATVTLLENLDIIMRKTPPSELKAEVLPMLYSALDSSTPQIQCAALHAVSQTTDYLDDHAVRSLLLPRTKQVFDANNGSVKVQANALLCLEKVLDKLEKTDILDEVMPMISKAKIQDPAILMPVVRIYKFMLGDKRYGLTVNVLATKVMPSLIPVVVSPSLKLEQFTALIELLRDMLEHVARSQRNKLKLEKLSMPSTEMIPVQYSMEQATGYPHRPPLLRLQSRRTSVSMDDVVRRINSASSSPDSNLLSVQGNLPGRRHSDNTIQPPRILVAPASPDGNLKRGSSAGILPIRRHSGDRFNSWTPKVVTPNFNIEFFTPSRGRRYSAAAVCATDLQRNATQLQQNQASSLLQQIGTGMQNLFSGTK